MAELTQLGDRTKAGLTKALALRNKNGFRINPAWVVILGLYSVAFAVTADAAGDVAVVADASEKCCVAAPWFVRNFE